MQARETVIETLAGRSITKCKGRKPKAADIDTTEKELAAIATIIKTSLFPGGERFGHLCCVLSDEAYGTKINDENFAFTDVQPEEPAPYDPAITAATPEHTRKIEWKPNGKSTSKKLERITVCKRY